MVKNGEATSSITFRMPSELEFYKRDSITTEDGKILGEFIETPGLQLSSYQNERYATYEMQQAATMIGLKFRALAEQQQLDSNYLVVTGITGKNPDPIHKSHKKGIDIDLSNFYINKKYQNGEMFKPDAAIECLRAIATTDNIRNVIYFDRTLWEKAIATLPKETRDRVRNKFIEDKAKHMNHIHVGINEKSKGVQ